MTLRDMALAAVTSIIWGFAFIATKIGLESFSAAQLTAARFIIASLPVVLLARPTSWARIIPIGLTLFAGQFLLLFFAYQEGMPPGLASVTQQVQAFFTVILAAIFLGETPTRRQVCGMTIAFAGLALVAATVGPDLKPLALALALASALSWAVGNILVKRIPSVPIVPLVIWCSLVPPLPAAIIAEIYDHRPIAETIATASWASIAAAVYLGAIATVLAYIVWGSLLRRYPSTLVVPFALLAPCTGFIASAVIFGESFTALRYAGIGLILTGLVVVIVPAPPGATPPVMMD